MRSSEWNLHLLVVCATAVLLVQTSAATNVIPSTVSEAVTWSGTNLVEGTVTVASNATVRIEPGTRVLMGNGASLVIRGQLLAEGTSADPITFTRSTSGLRWKQILFVNAQPSRFQHCLFEFANSAGTHLDYYDNDCNPQTAPPPRNYHEAIVALATQVDFDGCTFRNLPDSAAGGQGDAIAIISDDPQNPGTASAHIQGCQFIGIGQGVHTRYSSIIVEDCFFSGHNGDNDDIDMYGESDPPPLIRNNVFVNAQDDFINPTRCSAIIIGNVFAGNRSRTDHGIVLRDRGSPIVANNLVYNCPNGGIVVQNRCDALIINNTVINCDRGIRFFDHTGRLNAPYCLTPGNGTALVVNTIIWNCPTSLELTESANGPSAATVLFSNVQGGRASASVSANSKLEWGPGNLAVDPQFVNAGTNNFRLRPGSPCIDTGTNAVAFLTLPGLVPRDLDGVPRPLDGDGDDRPADDIGAYEFLLPTADSNGDGIPDGWLHGFGLDPTNPAVGAANPDEDPFTTFEEWIADTNPTDASSWFRVAGVSNLQPVTIYFQGSSNRQYTLFSSTGLSSPAWTPVPGQTAVPGVGGTTSLVDTNQASQKFYRIGVTLP